MGLRELPNPIHDPLSGITSHAARLSPCICPYTLYPYTCHPAPNPPQPARQPACRHLSGVAMRALSYYRDRGEEAAAGVESAGAAGGEPLAEGGRPQAELSAAEADAGGRLCRAAGIEDLLLWLASYEVAVRAHPPLATHNTQCCYCVTLL